MLIFFNYLDKNVLIFFFFFSSRRRHTRSKRDWSSDVCSSDLDLDDFKSVNDRFGHPVGDSVLGEFAETLRECVREIDLPSRWGGEEFGVVLPGTDLEGATRLAERARTAFEQRTILAPDGTRIHVTVSFGVAAFPEAADAANLVAASDGALYEAKRAGKNRVVTAAPRARHSE